MNRANNPQVPPAAAADAWVNTFYPCDDGRWLVRSALDRKEAFLKYSRGCRLLFHLLHWTCPDKGTGIDGVCSIVMRGESFSPRLCRRRMIKDVRHIKADLIAAFRKKGMPKLADHLDKYAVIGVESMYAAAPRPKWVVSPDTTEVRNEQ